MRCQDYMPRLQNPRMGDVTIMQKIFLGDCLLEVQWPSNILSILKNQGESIDTVLPWM